MTYCMTRRDAVRLSMAQTLRYLGEHGKDVSPEHLRELHDEGGDAWGDLLARLVRDARALVSEKGTWESHTVTAAGVRYLTERVDLDDVVAAAHLAADLQATAARGEGALSRAVNDAVTAYEDELAIEAAKVLNNTL